jgi:hypothetical protein
MNPIDDVSGGPAGSGGAREADTFDLQCVFDPIPIDQDASLIDSGRHPEDRNGKPSVRFSEGDMLHARVVTLSGYNVRSQF